MTRRLTSSTSAVCLLMAALVLTVAASAPAAPILPPLKFARAVTEVHRGRCEAVLDDLHALSEEAGPTGGRASYLLAHCLLKRGDIDAARSAFDRVAEHFPPLADHARLYAAEAVMQSGQSEEAAARLEQLLTATPVSSVARRARLIYADALIHAGEPVKAVVTLSRLLAGSLDDASYTRAWSLLGQAAENAGDRTLAVRAYSMAWWSVPDAPGADAAYQRLLGLQPERLPVPPADARLQRAGRLAAAGEFAAAEGELTDALHQSLPPDVAADAWFRLGIIRLMSRQGRFRGAERQFLDSAARFPATPRAAANLYWGAKVRARRGVDARGLLLDVARLYPMTFYGWRARELTGAAEPALQSAPAAMRLGDDRSAPTLEELAALGFDDDAVDLVEMDLDTTTDTPILQTAAWLWGRMDIYHRSVAAAERASRPTLRERPLADRELWTLAYPLAYWEDLRLAAEAQRVDPYLVLAVVREESRYNPRVVSLAGAVGLTQLLPTTASAVVGEEVRPSQLMDPHTNITLGTRYLAGLLRQFKGDTVLALAAYNAGPVAARRIARLPRADFDVFLESIQIGRAHV